MIGRPALGAVWPVLNKHLCCQQPIYVTVHATEEGRRQYYSVLQLPRGNYQHAFLSTAIVVARPNCPMQTHHLAITHGSSRIVQKIMQYMLKLSRVQGISVFMLNARRSSKIPPDMYTYGQRIYRAVQ